MPITQSRMIALLAAARNFQSAAQRALNIINDQRQSVKHGSITKAEAYDNIDLLLSDMLQITDDYSDSSAAIAIEQYHFHREARRNDRLRLKAQQKRRAAGILPSPRNPHPFGIPSISADQIYSQQGRALPPSSIDPATALRQRAIDREVDQTILQQRLIEAGIHPDQPQDIRNQALRQIAETTRDNLLKNVQHLQTDNLRKAADKSGVSIPDEVLKSFTDDADDSLF